MSRSKLQVLIVFFGGALAATVLWVGLDGLGGDEANLVESAEAKKGAPKVSPVKARADRDVYYPNTEDLGPNEMRVISCGTGMPNQRPAQAASCWLVELGNGDKFIFDMGTGSSERLSGLEIPYEYLNKVFLSHLHTDHMGDMDALFVGGLISGRVGPLHVWGPSGARPETGTAYAMKHMQEYLRWDIEGRAGRLPASGQILDVHEFDYKGIGQVVYKDKGVVIRSYPANHVIDGSVSFTLEWKGLKFAFSGDTYPNKWFTEGAKGADIAIHECFITVPDLVDKLKFPVARALEVGTQIHTPPPAFGKVMSEVNPRMAVAYHFFNDFDTAPKILEGIKQTYRGPLTLAEDMLVWNVTKKDIRVRSIRYEEHVWPPPPAKPAPPVDMKLAKDVSDFIKSGNLDVGDVIQKIYDRANKMYGTKLEPRTK
jgi:ribonuclease Z